MYLILIFLISINWLIGQQEYHFECTTGTIILNNTGSSTRGNYIDVIFTRKNPCEKFDTFTLDFNFVNVPDKIQIIDESNSGQLEFKYETDWIGLEDLLPDSTVLHGYVEYFNNSIVYRTYRMSEVPPDFFDRGYLRLHPGMGRMKFISQAPRVRIRLLANPLNGTLAFLKLHCSKALFEPDTIHKQVLTCVDVQSKYDTIVLKDCENVYIIDSVYVGAVPGEIDTFYIRLGEQSTIRHSDPSFIFDQNNSDRLSVQLYNQKYYPGTIENEYGCIVDGGVWVIIIEDNLYIPNAFTPNYDGTNDFFTAYTNPSIQLLNIEIYDRWGELIFSGIEWSGDFDGQQCLPGTYVYKATFKGPFSKFILAGDVTLIR